MKPLRWIASAWRDYTFFPEAAQNDAGYELYRVQCGDPPTDFKPMSGVGAGVYEIRIHTGEEYRIIYLAKFAEAVYVLHAFEKRTGKTSRRDLELARRRFAQVLRERNE